MNLTPIFFAVGGGEVVKDFVGVAVAWLVGMVASSTHQGENGQGQYG